MEELINQIRLRFDQLTMIHDEMGLETAKRQQNTGNLCQAVVALLDQDIKARMDERDRTLQQCQQTYYTIINRKQLMGEPVEDDSRNQHWEQYSLTLEKLTREKDIVQKEYERRLTIVKELYRQLDQYYIKFGDFVNMQLVMKSDVDVSLPAVTALKDEIQRCEYEYKERTRQVDSGMDQIQHLWEILGVTPHSELDQLLERLYTHHNDIDKKTSLYAKLVHDRQLDDIMQTIAHLKELEQQRECRKQGILQHLNHIWDRLKTDTDVREGFLQSNNGVSSADLQQYELELDRLLKLKSEKAEIFILDARNEIENLWNHLYFSKQEREYFTLFGSDDYGDTLLEAHENEIGRLKHMAEDRKYILDKVEQHMKLLQEIQDFESNTNDPKRLFGKGRRDPGRLLREEKFRKKISKELPKSKQNLKVVLHEFHTSTGSPFTVYGEPYLDQITADDKTGRSLEGKLPSTPKRNTTIKHPPMTSPRHQNHPKPHFHTPQYNRTNRSQNTIFDTKNEWCRLDLQGSSSTTSALHRVRQNNIRKKEQSSIISNSKHLIISNKIVKDARDMDDSIDESQQQERSGDTTSGDISTSSSGNDDTLVGKDYKKNENVAPPDYTTATSSLIQKTQMTRTLSERYELLFDNDDDDTTLDFGIFDDGPDLSDMSDHDV